MENKKSKDDIINYIRKNLDNDAKKMIKWVASNFINIEKDTLWMYQFFSWIYDELFYDIIFNKIEISNSTKKMLETLATPIYKKTATEQIKIFKKTIK
jgi:hypothetical protein